MEHSNIEPEEVETADTLPEVDENAVYCVICMEALSDSFPVDTDVQHKNKSVSNDKIGDNIELSEIASVSGCRHIYHDSCIKEWSSVTNSEYTPNCCCCHNYC